MRWKATLLFQLSQIVPTLTDCENRANRENWKQVVWKRHGGSWVSHIPSQKIDMKIEAGTTRWSAVISACTVAASTSVQMFVHTHAPLSGFFGRCMFHASSDLVSWVWIIWSKCQRQRNELHEKAERYLLTARIGHHRPRSPQGNPLGWQHATNTNTTTTVTLHYTTLHYTTLITLHCATATTTTATTIVTTTTLHYTTLRRLITLHFTTTTTTLPYVTLH